MVEFKFIDYGTDFGTRDMGQKLRQKLLALIGSGEKVALDFTGVNVVSNSFADECIAKLLLEMSLDDLKHCTTFRGLNPIAERSILVALQRRYNVIENKYMEEKESMKVSEPVATYTPTMFDQVISYLHSSQMPMETKRAVYLQLQAEVADENLGYMKRRLKEFANLQQGWDGEDAQPVLAEVVDFVSQILRSCSSLELADWSLFPNVNGTLLLQRKVAAISIGRDDYSYFAESKGKAIGHDHQPLSIESVVSTIETINRYV